MLKPETIKIQNDFAMYCRSGIEADIPGVTHGRLSHYRRLVSNVVKGAISQAFPIARKVLSEKEWSFMLESFFVEHDSQTPILWRLPYQFYVYAKDHSYGEKYKKPWLVELLWFEWLEIEVHMMTDSNKADYKLSGDVMSDPLMFNQDSRLIQLEYPVHLYPAERCEEKKGTYYVLIYRQMEGGTVHFISLTPLLAWLLDRLLNDNELPLNSLNSEMTSIFKYAKDDNAENYLRMFLEDLLEKGALLGFRILE